MMEVDDLRLVVVGVDRNVVTPELLARVASWVSSLVLASTGRYAD